jgi:4-nitrophenyl phosphatase
LNMLELVFLLVDNTLLDNDRLKSDLNRRISGLIGPKATESLWAIYEEVRRNEEYVDFPSTLDQFARHYPELPNDQLRAIVMEAPFSKYLYPGAFASIEYLATIGLPVIVSDGDPVFQRSKIERSGLAQAVDGRFFLTVHKQDEMDRVFDLFPARHYAMVDDKSTILADIERRYAKLITSVLVCQGRYARIRVSPPPDLVLPHIADIVHVPKEEFFLTSAGVERLGSSGSPLRSDGEPGEGAQSTGRRHCNEAVQSVTHILATTTHLLVDMDGVLFRGRSPLPGAAAFITWLRRAAIPFRLLTNNSTLTPEKNAQALGAMGIEIDADEIFTSSVATAGYLLERGAAGQKVFVIGEEGLLLALSRAGLDITGSPDDAQWLVAGLDRNVTYARLRDAALAVQHGARFVATNADTSLPVEDGLIPGAGALQSVITSTTAIRPVVVGKPEARMLELAARAIGGDRSNTAMLGDRLDTDVEAARRAGMASILILTGVTQRSNVQGTSAAPDVVVENLDELMGLWRSATAK